MHAVSDYLQPSFDSGHLSNFGQAYDKLCSRLHTHMGLSNDRGIVLVSSGHMALQAAYYVLGVKTPLVPDYTFRSTMVAAYGHVTVADCDENGFLDQESATSDYDGMVLVCPVSRIPNLGYYQGMCKKMNKPLVIDGAATYGTKGIYNYGDAFCISFHATKTFPMGEAGAVICSKENAKKIKQFINFGFDDNRNPVIYGTNAKVSEYTCAIGLAVLDKIQEDAVMHKRGSVSKIYEDRMKKFILATSSAGTVYQAFPIYIDNTSAAETVRNILAREEIANMQYYKPLIGLPHAKRLYDTNICLPCHHGITEQDANRICDLILKGI
jgi:dTDP-4-amino-4,6-dideoxygalactose transaminase